MFNKFNCNFLLHHLVYLSFFLERTAAEITVAQCEELHESHGKGMRGSSPEQHIFFTKLHVPVHVKLRITGTAQMLCACGISRPAMYKT